MIMEIILVMVITVPLSEQTLYVCAFLYVIKSKSNLTFNLYIKNPEKL